MQRKNPGIDVPVATKAEILHTAAFLEFKQHTEGLVEKGWLRSGTPPLLSLQCRNLNTSHPCSRCHAVQPIVPVAQRTWVGSNSPGWDCGPVEGSWSLLACLSRQLGSTTMLTAMRRSTSSSWRCTLQAWNLKRWSPRTCTPFSFELQRTKLGSWGWASSFPSGASGSDVSPPSAIRPPSSTLACSLGQSGGDPGQPWGRREIGHSELFGDGLKLRMPEPWRWEQAAWNVVTQQGEFAGDAVPGFAICATTRGTHARYNGQESHKVFLGSTSIDES